MIINANALSIPLADKCVHTIITSPPYYGLRDYGVVGQLGLEPTPDEYIANLVSVFRECKRVLRDDGTLWVNIGDSYASNGEKQTGRNDENPIDIQRRFEKYGTGRPKALVGLNERNKVKIETGLKPKDLIGIPWMLAFALRADGWYLRQDIIWAKLNPMPESVKDRCTKSHEDIFLLSKSAQYYCNMEAIREPAKYSNEERYDRVKDGHKSLPDENKNGIRQRKPAGWDTSTKQGAHGAFHRDGRAPDVEYTTTHSLYRNKRDVWFVSTKPYKGAHFATFNPELIKPCILAGAPEGGIVFDPFVGSGTTVATAMQLGRKGIGLDLSLKYLHENATARIDAARLPLMEMMEA